MVEKGHGKLHLEHESPAFQCGFQQPISLSLLGVMVMFFCLLGFFEVFCVCLVLVCSFLALFFSQQNIANRNLLKEREL